MNWSFRSKLILALLLFSLVPTLIMSFVMYGLSDLPIATGWRSCQELLATDVLRELERPQHGLSR